MTSKDTSSKFTYNDAQIIVAEGEENIEVKVN